MRFVSLLLFIGFLTSTRATDLSIVPIQGSEPGFLATATLVSGDKDAVLIDAMFLRSDAHRLAARILESGKQLKAILITHAHPDHVFGLEVLSRQFPQAEILASAETIEHLQVMGPQKISQWKPVFGENLTDKVFFPKAMSSSTYVLEGHELRMISLGQGDTEHSSIVHIPSAKTVIAGDFAYTGVHPWLVEADASARKQWHSNLARIRSLNPKFIIAGHRREGDSTSADDVLSFMNGYLDRFEKATSSTATPEKLEQAMLHHYKDLKLPIILNLSGKAAFGQL